MAAKTSGSAMGFPHSSHSGGVKGRSRIEHCVQHIDKRHVRDHAGEQFGSEIDGGAHEHSARAAARRHDPPGARDSRAQ